MTKTRNIGKAFVIVMMMILIAIGGLMTYRIILWNNGPGEDDVRGFADVRSIENNYIMNERKVLAHRIRGDEPTRTVYCWSDNKGNMREGEFYLYPDGAMEFKMF